MDTSCSCFGIAASSRRPVKRYNDLVPDCFPRVPPPVTQRSDAAQERKYKKLCEYLNNNPDRIPKASPSSCALASWLVVQPSTACETEGHCWGRGRGEGERVKVPLAFQSGCQWAKFCRGILPTLSNKMQGLRPPGNLKITYRLGVHHMAASIVRCTGMDTSGRQS